MSHETQLAETLARLGLELPSAAGPKGVYRPALEIDGHLYLSGHLPIRPDGSLLTGRVGENLTEQEGYQAARLCGLALLATARAQLGSLDRVRQVVKLLGAVNSTPDFSAQPAVINGCSELLIEVFGSEVGKGARSALGVASLPLGAAVEIEAVFALDD